MVTPRTVQVVLFVAPGGGMHVAKDGGQVLGWQLPELAELFAERLAELATPATLVLPRSPAQLVELLDLHDLSPERVDIVEAQALGPEDATAWTVELAERVAAALLRAAP